MLLPRLPLLESVSATGAMLYFLQRILDGRLHRYDSQGERMMYVVCLFCLREEE